MFGECHGHIFMNGVNYKAAVRDHREDVCKDLVRETLKTYAEAGITFFREGGDHLGVSSYAREIAPEYGIDYRSPVFAIHKKGLYGGIVGFAYETEADFVRLLRQAAEMGADFIKLMYAGILDFGTVGKVSEGALSYEEMKRLVHICHEEGFSVMAHVNQAEHVGNALLAGTDSIEHGNYMTRQEIDLLKETGAVWVPTVAPYGNLLGRGLFPDEAIREMVKRQSENVRLALSEGCHVALGSDAGAVGVPHGKGLMDEYEYMLAAAEGDKELLDKVLTTSEALVKERFQRH